MVFWIVIGSVVGFLILLACLPIWGIKWKYANLERATVIDLVPEYKVNPKDDDKQKEYNRKMRRSLLKERLKISNIPLDWLCADDRNLTLWTIFFGKVSTGKGIQSYTSIYNIGSNVRYRIGISLLELFR